MRRRVILIDYLKFDLAAIMIWMKANDYQYVFLTGNEWHDEYIGNLTALMEVFTAEAEVATRLKWETNE